MKKIIICLMLVIFMSNINSSTYIAATEGTLNIKGLSDRSHLDKARVDRGDKHSREAIPYIIPAGTEVTMRQASGTGVSNLEVQLLNNDSATESKYSLSSSGSNLVFTAQNEGIIFIKYPRGKQNIDVAYSFSQDVIDAPYYFEGDDEEAFFSYWDSSMASYAIVENENVQFLIPAADKEYLRDLKSKGYFDNIDGLLEYYTLLVESYDYLLGLEDNPENPAHANSDQQFFAKANKSGPGLGYYSVNEMAMSAANFGYRFLSVGWIEKHEIAHGYQQSDMMDAVEWPENSISVREVWNNIYAHNLRTQVEWYGDNIYNSNRMSKSQLQHSSNNGYNAGAHTEKLNFFVAMFDAFGYEGFRGFNREYRELAVVGKNKEYVNTQYMAWFFSKHAGVNFVPHFEQSQIEIIEEIEDKKEIRDLSYAQYLNFIILDDTKRKEVATELGLRADYQMVDTSLLRDPKFDHLDLKSNVTVNLDIDNIDEVKNKPLILKNGQYEIKKEITSNQITFNDVPAGVYRVLAPTSESGLYHVEHSKLITLTEAQDVNYTVTYEDQSNIKIDTLAGWNDVILIGSSGVDFATLETFSDRIRIRTKNRQPNSSSSEEYARITIKDKDGNVLYNRSFIGNVTLVAETVNIPYEPGCEIEIYLREPTRTTAVNNYSKLDISPKTNIYTIMLDESGTYINGTNILTDVIDKFAAKFSTETDNQFYYHNEVADITQSIGRLEGEQYTTYSQKYKTLLQINRPEFVNVQDVYEYTLSEIEQNSVDVEKIVSQVQATDVEDGDVSSNITIVDHNVNLAEVGTYTMDLKVSDSVGNNAYTTINVSILGDDAPVISFENITVNEDELSSDVNVEELLKVSVEDKEDDITGFKTELIVDAGTIDYHKPGVYNVFISATDGQGQTASETATITINDLQPKITSSINTVELPLGINQDLVNYTQLFDVKATEITDGDLTSKLIVTSNVNFATTGLYTVNFLVTDDEGNTDTLDRTVKIVRNNHDDIEIIDNEVNTRPEIELTKLSLDVNEHNPLSASELISKYGVSATDDFDTNLQINVDQSKVEYTKPGIYEIEFSATDSKGLKAVQTAELKVIDVLPAINGNRNNVELQLSEANDQIDFIGLFEVQASEITDGDLTSKINVDFSAVNFNATGSYTVSFLVTDDEGNTDTLDRTVKIVRNNHSDIETIDNGVNTRPEIGLTKLSLDVNEHNPLSASELISKYGVSATDDFDTNLQINVDQSKVDYTKPGIYEIEFSATDSKGLKAVQTAELKVIDVLPAINGNRNNVELQLSKANDQIDFIGLFEVQASEITDGDLTSKINVDFSEVNFNVTGSYTVSFLVTDDEGNTDTLDRTLELIRNMHNDIETIDNGVNTRPEIGLTKLSLDVNEHNPLSASELISKYGVSATDDFDTNLQINVDQSKVDYTKPGIYEIEFSATDSKGLNAVQTAELKVIDVLPAINGNRNNVELQLSEANDQIDFVGLFEVKASEITDGDLTSKINVDFSEVNFNVTGTYNVHFRVIDEEGNTDTLDRTVKIIRNNHDDIGIIDNGVNTRPEIELTKLSLDVNEHNPLSASELISKYGVSATDDFDTNLQINVDQSKVDYTKPGIYEIEFSATDSKGLNAVQTAELKVIDVLPAINGNKNNVELQLSEANDQIDFVGLFEVKATEITDGDLTSEIIVDFSEVNFNVTGTYNVYFRVIDEEGNETFKTTKLVITRSTLGDTGLIDNTVDPLPEIDSETAEKEDTVVSEVETSAPEETVEKSNTVANEVSESNVVVNSSNKSKSTKDNKVEANNKNSEYKEMTLTNTGQESMFIFLIAALLGLISIKKLSNKKASANL